MRTAPQLLVTGAPASDDPNDHGRPVELRYDASLRRLAAEQALLRSAVPKGENEDMATALPRRPSSAAPVLRKGEPYLRSVGSRPGSAAARRSAPLRPTDVVAAQSIADEPLTGSCVAGGATPPAAAARSRPSSAQPRPTRCGSCGSCVPRPSSASCAGAVADGGASVRARPSSAALGRGAAGRGSTVSRAASVPALQLGRLHEMARPQVLSPLVLAPISPSPSPSPSPGPSPH
jgi:hypothetical protein